MRNLLGRLHGRYICGLWPHILRYSKHDDLLDVSKQRANATDTRHHILLSSFPCEGHCLVSLLEAATNASERLCPVCRAVINAATPNYAVRSASASNNQSDSGTDARIRTLLSNTRGGGGTAAGRNLGPNLAHQADMSLNTQLAAGVAVALYVTTGFGLPPEVLHLVDNAAVVVCTVLVLSFLAGRPLLG